MLVQQTVPCKRCGTSTFMIGTKLCDRCWELEKKIRFDPELSRQILQEVMDEQAPD